MILVPAQYDLFMWTLRALAANCTTSGTLSTTNAPPTIGSSETDNVQWLTFNILLQQQPTSKKTYNPWQLIEDMN